MFTTKPKEKKKEGEKKKEAYSANHARMPIQAQSMDVQQEQPTMPLYNIGKPAHLIPKMPLQRKATKPEEAVPEAATQQVPVSQKPNNTGIPDAMKARFENLSGFSFDDVKVHYNSDKPAQLQALAYAQGNQVYMGPGQEKHLGHELGHVVQQKQGATQGMNGGGINHSPILEEQAENIARGNMISVHGAPKDQIQLMYDNKNEKSYPWTEMVKDKTPYEMIAIRRALMKLNDPKSGSKIVEDKKPADGKEDFTATTMQQSGPNEPKSEDKLIDERFVKDKEDKESVNNITEFYEKVNKNMSNSTYWIGIPTWATGDLTSLSAYVINTDEHGIAMYPGEFGKNDMGTNLPILTSFLGGISDSDDKQKYVVTKHGAQGKFMEKAPSNSVKFTGGTPMIAKDWNIKWRQNVRTAWGVDTGDVSKDVKAEREYDNAVAEWLKEKFKLTDKDVNNKDIVVLWIRKSGERGGAHFENDTSFEVLKKQIESHFSAGKTVILAGDDKLNSKRESKAAKLVTDNNKAMVFNLTEFWKDSETAVPLSEWGGATRTGQFRLYDYLNRHAQSLVHIGPMSGNLEAMALLGHQTIVHAGSRENDGVRRMLQYTEHDKNWRYRFLLVEDEDEEKEYKEYMESNLLNYNIKWVKDDLNLNTRYEKKAAYYFIELRKRRETIFTNYPGLTKLETRVEKEFRLLNNINHYIADRKKELKKKRNADKGNYKEEADEINKEENDLKKVLLINPKKSKSLNLRALEIKFIILEPTISAQWISNKYQSIVKEEPDKFRTICDKKSEVELDQILIAAARLKSKADKQAPQNQQSDTSEIWDSSLIWDCQHLSELIESNPPLFGKFLNFCLRKADPNGLRETGEVVHAADQNIFNTAIFQLIEYG